MENIVSFFGSRDFGLHFGKTFFKEKLEVVEDAIGVVYLVDFFSLEACTTQTYEVETAVGNRLTGGCDEGRNVLSCA